MGTTISAPYETSCSRCGETVLITTTRARDRNYVLSPKKDGQFKIDSGDYVYRVDEGGTHDFHTWSECRKGN